MLFRHTALAAVVICALSPMAHAEPVRGQPQTIPCAATPTLADMAKAAPSLPYIKPIVEPRRLPAPVPAVHPGADAPAAPTPPAPATPSAPLAPRGPGGPCPGPGLFFGAQVSFQGLDDNFTRIPPDTMGAVGPSHVMTTLNSQVRITDRAGTPLSTVPLLSFWSPPLSVTDVFDPVLHYDALSARWIFIVCAQRRTADSAVLLGVSQTADPTGPWNIYRIDADAADADWADYAKFGVNSRWIVITANMYGNVGDPFRGSKMWVVDKVSTLAPGSPISLNEFPEQFDLAAGVYGSTLRPALCLDASSGDDLFMINGIYEDPMSHATFYRLSRVFGALGSPQWEPFPGSGVIAGSGLFASQQAFATTCPPAAQFGSPQTIDTGDTRIQSAVWRNGTLWFTHHAGLPVPPPATTPAPDRLAVVWNQVGLLMPTPTIQSGLIDLGISTFAFYPSIAVNCRNDALIGYSYSDPGVYASAAYSYRYGASSSGVLDSTNTIYQPGAAPYYKTFSGSRNRWGDYSNTVVDPLNDTDLCTLQEYADSPAGATDRWAVQWLHLPNVQCVPPAFFAHPGSLTRCENQTATFSAGFTSTIPPSLIQWRRNGVNLANDARHSGVNTATLLITGLTVADTGAYTLFVSHTCGSALSNAATLTVNPAAPASPAVIAGATTTLCDRVTLNWFGVTNATTYTVKRATTNNPAAAATIATVSAPTLTYPDTTAVAGATYFYWIDASNSCGASGIAGSGQSGRRLPLPPIPLPASVTGSCTGVQLNWTPSADAATYSIRRSATNVFAGSSLVTTVPFTAATYFDSAAPAGASFFWIVPTNACGDGTPAGPYSATVDITQPATAVAAVSFTPCPAIRLTWTASANATGYSIRRSLSSDFASSTIIGADTASPFSDNTGTPGSTYFYWVVATRTGCPAGAPAGPASALARIPTQITVDPPDTHGVRNQSVSFHVTAIGAGPLTYEWRAAFPDGSLSGARYTGVNTDTLTILDVRSSDANAYYCRVGGQCATVDSAAASLTVESSCQGVASASVMFDPAVCVGDSLFIHASTGNATYPISYIWRKDGVVMPGITDYGFFIPSLTVADAAAYTCEVDNPCTSGSITTAANTLTARTPPTINSQPVSLVRCNGQSASFSVSASSFSTPGYQWRVNGGNINGATSSTYTIPSVSSGSAGVYDCVVSNSCGSVISDPATLTFAAVPTITSPPAPVTVCTPTGFSLSVTATGAPNLTYQWKKNGSDIPGATSSTYTKVSSTTLDSGSYTCVVTSICGSTPSAAAAVTVRQSINVITSPFDTTRCVGQSVTFQAFAAGEAPLTFQWRKNGANIPGASGNYTSNTVVSYTIPSVTLNDDALFDCLFTNPCGQAASAAGHLTVATPYAVTQHPATPNILCVGQPLNLSVSVSGIGGVSYQWRKNFVNIPGATLPTLAFPSIATTDAALYDCLISSFCSSSQSNPAEVLVATAPPQITTQPVGGYRCVGQNISFSFSFIANTPAGLTLQWRRNGVNIPGANNSTLLLINPVTPLSFGVYDCVLTNPCGTATTSPATLAVCAPDFNCSGAVTVQDIFDFLAAYFAGDPRADFNASGAVSVQDIFDFLAAYFNGCS